MATHLGFDDPLAADSEGVVAVGGPIDGPRLLAAYRGGIFPWSGDPVRWHSPDPRSIFWRVRPPRRLGKLVRRGGFSISFDRAFDEVTAACAEHHESAGVWITPAFLSGYGELHRMGHAHSVEVWQGETLVGGLYGVQVGGLFSGESMFYRVPNASKVAFAALATHLLSIGIVLFDSQVINAHTYALGAVLVHRSDYLRLLELALDAPARHGGEPWPDHGGGSLVGTPLACATRAPEAAAAQAITPPYRFWSLETAPK